MRLWVANISRQRQVLWYRLDAGQTNGNFTPPKQQSIEPGQQSTVGGDIALPAIETIVGQLAVYGLVGETDVPNKLRGIHELVFNLDRKVSDRAIRAVHAHNLEVKMLEGKQRRERAAIGANEALKVATSEAELSPPPEFDLEIEQMEQSFDERRIEEGFHVKSHLSEVPSDILAARRKAS